MTKSILVVDDDQAFLTLLREHLNEDGYRVLTAPDAASAWQILQDELPALALVDWYMPGESGTELVGRVKQNPKLRSTFVIMISGHVQMPEAARALDGGADDYLTKSFTLEELSARVRAGLRIRALEKRLVSQSRMQAQLELASSVADKIGNPVAAARLYADLLMDNPAVAGSAEAGKLLRDLRGSLAEALDLLCQVQCLRTQGQGR